jgi:hypothetical protein
MLNPAEGAAELVGKMLRNYDSAQTLTGTIRFTQSVQNVSIVIDTNLQWAKPAKLFIRQDRRSSDPRTYFVTSDGKTFSYDLPEDRAGAPGERLFEPVSQPGRTLDYRDIYAAASRSLGDRSAPIDIAICRTEDLKFIRGQWATMEFAEKPGPDGVRVIVGDWRQYANAPASGSFEMWITDDGDLKKYVQRETFQPEASALDEKFRPHPVPLNVGPLQITSVWDVNLKVNGAPDPSLFKVIK